MKQSPTDITQLENTVLALRAPSGCPWDRKQTTLSMVKYLKAEFQEVLDAIAANDPENLCEELGDLLYIIVMLSTINAEQKLFNFQDVIDGINEKLIRRHPHVFGDVTIESEEELRAQWNRIKAEEKAATAAQKS